MADFGIVTPHLGRYVDGTGLDFVDVATSSEARVIKDSTAENTIYYCDGAFLCQNVYGGAITYAEVTEGTYLNTTCVWLNNDSSRLYFTFYMNNNHSTGDMYINYILTADMSTFGTPLSLAATSNIDSTFIIDKDGWAWIRRYNGQEIICVNLADNTILRYTPDFNLGVISVNKDSELIGYPYTYTLTNTSLYCRRNVGDTDIDADVIPTPYSYLADCKFMSDGRVVAVSPVNRQIAILSGTTLQTEDVMVTLPATVSDAHSLAGLMIGLNGDIYIGWHDLGNYRGGGSISVAFYKYDSNLSNRETLSTAVAPFGTMIDMNGYVHRTITRGL